jgi:hypothetical protein
VIATARQERSKPLAWRSEQQQLARVSAKAVIADVIC